MEKGFIMAFINIKSALDIQQDLNIGLIDEIKIKRNTLLTNSDYLVMPDYPIDPLDKQKIIEYRQLLRDIPTQKNYPKEVIYPMLPSIITLKNKDS
jgi:hypothetical protein